MTVTYIERVPIDRFRMLDTVKTFCAISSFSHGNLTYFKTDRYNYKVIGTDFVLSIEEGY